MAIIKVETKNNVAVEKKTVCILLAIRAILNAIFKKCARIFSKHTTARSTTPKI